MKRWLKIPVLTVIAIPVIATAVFWAYELSDFHAQREQYAVYSDFITHELQINDHDYVDRKCLLVILDHSEKPRAPLANDRPKSMTEKLSRDLELHSLRTVKFEQKFSLPVPYKLINLSSIDSEDLNTQLTADEQKMSCGGMVTFTRIAFNRTATTAFFYAEHLYCGLCGGGEYVLMQKQQGHWVIVDEQETWIS